MGHLESRWPWDESSFGSPFCDTGNPKQMNAMRKIINKCSSYLLLYKIAMETGRPGNTRPNARWVMDLVCNFAYYQSEAEELLLQWWHVYPFSYVSVQNRKIIAVQLNLFFFVLLSHLFSHIFLMIFLSSLFLEHAFLINVRLLFSEKLREHYSKISFREKNERRQWKILCLNISHAKQETSWYIYWTVIFYPLNSFTT